MPRLTSDHASEISRDDIRGLIRECLSRRTVYCRRAHVESVELGRLLLPDADRPVRIEPLQQVHCRSTAP